MEIGTARAYSSEIGKPLVIPILIDDVPIPLPLHDIQILFAKERDADQIVLVINRALLVSAGQEAAKEKRAEETARKIESNASAYIEEAYLLRLPF